jgi:hypothetical protein
LIDLIQKFRLSDSTIDHNYSLNSVDVIINGGHAGSQMPCAVDYHNSRSEFVTPPAHPSGQFVWMPKESYIKPSSKHGTKQGARSHQQDRYREKGCGRDRSSRGDNRDNKHLTDDRHDQNSRGDKSSRGDKDLSKWDRDHRPRGDTAKSVSKGGDRKRDRSSPSRDHQDARTMGASSNGQRRVIILE